MEAATRVSIDCHASMLVLSQQIHPARINVARLKLFVHHKRRHWTSSATRLYVPFADGRSRRAFPITYLSRASSVPVENQRWDYSLSVGTATIPHPEKVEKGGEDAFFVSTHNGGILGVADGVSGWAEENVDPAVFSRELMEKAMRALHSDAVQNCPRWLLAKAHEATSATGAATAIVAILEKETGILHIANLGDCGLRVVREGKVIFATSPQQHYFDCPYQLSSEPEAQTSKDATVYEVQLQSRDVIIMASDGLFDNVFDKDIENTVNLLWGSGDEFPQRLASALASLASKHSRDPKYESPYSQEAILQGYDLPLWRKLLGQKRTGGKLDDITVLTAYVITDQAHSLDSPIQSEVSSRSVEEMDPYPIPIWASQS